MRMTLSSWVLSPWRIVLALSATMLFGGCHEDEGSGAFPIQEAAAFDQSVWLANLAFWPLAPRMSELQGVYLLDCADESEQEAFDGLVDAQPDTLVLQFVNRICADGTFGVTDTVSLTLHASIGEWYGGLEGRTVATYSERRNLEDGGYLTESVTGTKVLRLGWGWDYLAKGDYWTIGDTSTKRYAIPGFKMTMRTKLSAYGTADTTCSNDCWSGVPRGPGSYGGWVEIAAPAFDGMPKLNGSAWIQTLPGFQFTGGCSAEGASILWEWGDGQIVISEEQGGEGRRVVLTLQGCSGPPTVVYAE